MASRRKNKNNTPSPMDDLEEIGPAGNRRSGRAGHDDGRIEPSLDFSSPADRHDGPARMEDDLFDERAHDSEVPAEEPPFSEERAYDAVEPAAFSEDEINAAEGYVSDSEFHSENGRGPVVILPPVERRMRDDGPSFGPERRASRRVMDDPIIDAKPVRRSSRWAGRAVVAAVFLIAIALPFLILMLPGLMPEEAGDPAARNTSASAAVAPPSRIIELAPNGGGQPSGPEAVEATPEPSLPPEPETAAAETVPDGAPQGDDAAGGGAETGEAMAALSGDLHDVQSAVERLDAGLGERIDDIVSRLERLQEQQQELQSRQDSLQREQAGQLAALNRRIEQIEARQGQAAAAGPAPAVTASASAASIAPGAVAAAPRLPEVITGPGLGRAPERDADSAEAVQEMPADEMPDSLQAIAPAMPSPRPSNLNTRPVVSQPASARMPVLGGWVVRDVFNGMAVIQSRFGVLEVVPGSVLPGGIVVQEIRTQGRSWIVVTSRGIIRAQPW